MDSRSDINRIRVNDEISFTLPRGPVGLSFSAGLDSTILFYLLAQQCKEDLHLFTTAMVPREFHAMRYAADVMLWVQKRTGKKNMFQHVTVKGDANDVLGGNGLYETPSVYYSQGIVKSVVTGHNALPRDVDLGWPEPDSKEYNIRTPYETRSIEFSENWFSPLTNLNKKGIAQLYLENGAIQLAHLTNSCYTKYHEEPCKQCFACKEKYWGFGFY
ncbi:MAG: hypothetical protein CMP47_12260 [Rickettsiales bacterium]|nr:hypothetical protein [Rickettsiales bacterium]